jgi:hypothetical protein
MLHVAASTIPYFTPASEKHTSLFRVFVLLASAGDFKNDLNDETDSFDEEQCASLVRWRDFYRGHSVRCVGVEEVYVCVWISCMDC